jgi:hypothetical protein
MMILQKVPITVIPLKAGIQKYLKTLDSPVTSTGQAANQARNDKTDGNRLFMNTSKNASYSVPAAPAVPAYVFFTTTP